MQVSKESASDVSEVFIVRSGFVQARDAKLKTWIVGDLA